MVLSLKQRINKMEQAKPSGPAVAVFYIPGNIPVEQQNKLKEQLWGEYLEDGGDSSLQMVVDRNLTDKIGFIKTMSGEEWFPHISNRSKNPAETFVDKYP